jgi:MFS family permease
MLHLGNTIALLIVARILQGFSAAVVWIVGLALLPDSFSNDEIGHAIGYVFLGMSLGILLGPVLGGMVFDKLGYNAVFIMIYCLILVDIALRIITIEKKVAKKWLSDCPAVQSEQIELQVSPPIEMLGPELEETNEPNTIGRKYPPVLLLLRSPSFLASLWASAVLAILMTSFDAVLPLRVKEVFHFNSLGAGLYDLFLTKKALLFVIRTPLPRPCPAILLGTAHWHC